MADFNFDMVDNIFDALEIAKKANALLPPLPPDIKPVHMRVLHAIHRSRDQAGYARITDINNTLGFLLPNTTKFINELVGLQVVQKSTQPGDKRVVLINATHTGEQYIERYILRYHTLLQEQFSFLGEADCGKMINTIQKVYQAMKKVYQDK